MHLKYVKFYSYMKAKQNTKNCLCNNNLKGLPLIGSYEI